MPLKCHGNTGSLSLRANVGTAMLRLGSGIRRESVSFARADYRSLKILTRAMPLLAILAESRPSVASAFWKRPKEWWNRARGHKLHD